MGEAGWICGGLVVAGVAYLAIARVVDARRAARHGQLVRAWIVFANDSLHQPRDGDAHSYAQVVFNLDPDTPDNRAELQRLAAEVRAFRPAPDGAEVEHTIGRVIKSQVPLLGEPLRLPDRLTGGRRAYTASVEVYWNRLPDRRLSRGDLYLKVIVFGRPAILHVPYPEGADAAAPA